RELALAIGARLGLTGQELQTLAEAALISDIGEAGIREEVLTKPGRFTAEEYEHVKEHVVIGSQILAPLSHLGPIVAFVRGHHEHFDGSGYPDRLQGEDIPLGARIICAAEIYDALTTARPYQPMMTPEQAAERMQRLAGSVVDPQVLDAIAAAVTKRQTLVFLDEDASAGH
ncbi:MAG: HD domain-containing protein, partial [Gemmatimonadetes bacterium]|nr:HD domain-containing protein [Gemmatimonadota bacterium]